ncbi:MAG: hypothetical protein R6V34_03405, partial [Bacteroidales bacterium]
MKAKYLTGIIAGLLVATAPIKAAETPAETEYFKPSPGVQITTSVRGHDFYYASRIRRFHSSYVSFGFYAPVYTETYWYNYRPTSWGISIYAGNTTFGMGWSFGYPAYYYGGGYYSPWSYYGGYYPDYYYGVYPVIRHRTRIRYNYHIHNHYYYANNYTRPRHHYQKYTGYNDYYNYPARKYASSGQATRSRRNAVTGTNSYNRNTVLRAGAERADSRRDNRNNVGSPAQENNRNNNGNNRYHDRNPNRGNEDNNSNRYHDRNPNRGNNQANNKTMVNAGDNRRTVIRTTTANRNAADVAATRRSTTATDVNSTIDRTKNSRNIQRSAVRSSATRNT